MGTVYLATHEASGDEAAVKVLPASLAREGDFVERFGREVESLKKLKNRHVVELVDYGVEDETYYYSMEYVEGETLTQRIRSLKRIDWSTVIKYTIQICSALKAAHDAGIIHRDLKPSNLLIDKNDQLKLTDFGVAQVFAATKLTKTGGIIGTAEYMSPEQAQGKRVTKKSDIYSLGAVMYVMLTGRPPFTGRNTQEVIHKHLTALFDRPQLVVPSIPSWLDQAVCKCMEKNPDKRFPDAFVLSKHLMEIERKVDLSREHITLAEGETRTAETAVLGESHSGETGREHVIGGTFVRDVVKAEIENAQRKPFIARIFDNTFVLIGLLIALIAGTAYWWQTSNLSQEQMYERGSAMLEQNPGMWSEARDKYLVPLLNLDEEKWKPKVQPLLDQITEMELSRPFDKKPVWSSQSEPERILEAALKNYKDGDVQRAQNLLSSLIALTADNPELETFHEAARKSQIHIRSHEAERKRIAPFVSEAIQNAKEKIAENKKEKARSILQNLIVLYDGHAELKSELRRARELLEELETEQAQ